MRADHHQTDEMLETLYHLHERHHLSLEILKEHEPSLPGEALDDLVAKGLLTVEQTELRFTADGFKRAETIVRRHRLAERLLNDVLHMGPEDVETGACEFEHLLAEEITESICILLGHPRTCPHGSPIPKGPCCEAAATEVRCAVAPLTSVPVGAWARVAYVASKDDERHHRFAHFGIAPGNKVKMHQLRPSVIVVSEGSMLAMEESIARDIFVWKGWRDEEAAPGAGGAPRGGDRPGGVLDRLLGRRRTREGRAK
jgi:DtxR family transcriptional regulator, Mn-dependent transcriptional regulator